MSLLISLAPSAVTAYALNLLLHVTVMCLLALWAARRVFRRDPAGRHFLCLTGLVCLLLTPALVGLEANGSRSLATLALPNADSAEPIASRSSAVLSHAYSRSDVVTSSAGLTQEAASSKRPPKLLHPSPTTETALSRSPLPATPGHTLPGTPAAR